MAEEGCKDFCVPAFGACYRKARRWWTSAMVFCVCFSAAQVAALHGVTFWKGAVGLIVTLLTVSCAIGGCLAYVKRCILDLLDTGRGKLEARGGRAALILSRLRQWLIVCGYTTVVATLLETDGMMVAESYLGPIVTFSVFILIVVALILVSGVLIKNCLRQLERVVEAEGTACPSRRPQPTVGA